MKWRRFPQSTPIRAGFTLALVLLAACMTHLPAAPAADLEMHFPVTQEQARNCVLRAFKQQQLYPVGNPARDSVMALARIPGADLSRLSDSPAPEGGWSDAMISANASITPDGANSVTVVVKAALRGRPALESFPGRTFRMSDWRILKSNGTLEREWQASIQSQCAAAPAPSPTSTP